MPNPERWDKCRSAADSIWTLSDNMWKVWRWWSVGFFAFAVHDMTSNVPAMIIGFVVSGIGVLSLAAWLFGAQVGGLTEKGRNGGPVQTGFVMLLFLSIAFFIALNLWAITGLVETAAHVR